MFHPRGPSFSELARQSLSSTERGYDLLASKFDLTPFRTPDKLLLAVADELDPVDNILDICCGTGAGLKMLAPLCQRRLVGIDFSRGMLEQARQRLGPLTASTRLELLHGDVLQMSLARQFDLITCFGALGHFPPGDQPRLFTAVFNALIPGGRWVFVTAPRPSWWSPGLWLAAGFDTTIALRNLLWRPPFIMYYLNMLLPKVAQDLEQHGFKVEVRERFWPPSSNACLVLAQRPNEQILADPLT